MISSVVCWRCNCGASLKATAEINSINDTVELEVGCPKCGEKQLVYAHGIIAVSVEMPEARE